MTEVRKKILANDYYELMSMQGAVLSVKPISGVPPYIDEYELTINLCTIIGPEPTYRDVHIVRILLPDGYPLISVPRVMMITKPYPYHTHWYRSGYWDSGSWKLEGIGNFVVRMMKTLQFDPDMIDIHSTSNCNATDWYIKNQNTIGLFPCDTTQLPKPFDINNTNKQKGDDIT